MTASTGRSRRPDHGPGGRYVFFSHDGYGVGHLRRNALIAHEILAQDPAAEVTLVTGVCRLPAWTIDPRICVVPVPTLVKGPEGVYGNDTLSFEQTVARRSQVFARSVAWRGRTLGITALHIWRIENQRDGTRVFTEESWTGPLARVLRSSMTKTVRKALDDGLPALKREAEDRARATS